MERVRLHLRAIETSLRDVQRVFPQINEVLHSRRDSMTDEVVERMLAGYRFIDTAIANNVDLLDSSGIHGLLELNHIVLCGLDRQTRREHRKHIEATTRRFYNNHEEGFDVDAIMQWYGKHEGDSVWKRAAGVYVRVLSQPQLYLEGNHRTGSLIMSYILAREGKPPFVLSVANAKAYFDPSSLIKQTRKTTVSLLAKLPRMKKRFAAFLHDQTSAHPQYLRKTEGVIVD